MSAVILTKENNRYTVSFIKYDSWGYKQSYKPESFDLDKFDDALEAYEKRLKNLYNI